MMESKLPNIPKKCPKGSHILYIKVALLEKALKVNPDIWATFVSRPIWSH